MEARVAQQPAPPLRLVVSEPRSVPRVRATLEAVAGASGLGRDETFDLKVAASEALANALTHAAADRPGVEVSVASAPDAVEIEIIDRGRFVMSNGFDASRGRGLPLMVALADEVEFASLPDGTRVRIRKRAGRGRRAA